jgi:hypothetical protein
VQREIESALAGEVLLPQALVIDEFSPAASACLR